MAKRCIGLDINSSHIHAVQLTCSDGRFHTEKTFSTPTRRENDSTSELLKSLIGRYGFDRRAPVAISTPHNEVFFRNTKNNPVLDKQYDSHQTLKTKFDFPIPSRDIILADCPPPSSLKNENFVLVTATNKKSLESQICHLENAKMRCCLADAPIFALHTAVMTNHPQLTAHPAVIIYTDDSHIILAVTSDKDIILARNLPLFSDHDQANVHSTEKLTQILLQEIEISWRAAFREIIPENTNIVLAGSITKHLDLISSLQQSLNCQISTADLSAKVTSSADSKLPPEHAIAQGLALRALAPHDTVGVNFIKVIEENTKKNLDCKKPAILSLALLATLAGAYLTGIFITKALWENKYTNIKNEIRQVFQQTLPDQTNIVDELAQMDEKLQTLRKEYASLQPFDQATLDPLSVLHHITANTPDNLNIEINNMSVTNSSAHITAVCNSFEDAYKWEKLLQSVSRFKSVQVQSPRKQPDSNMVEFTVFITFNMD
ncbi:MAG: hypothetical protein JXD22_10825 [Sedimentisphaerales bacterium]|nr:hypothetical protein [Sedimentisphaerales bacterium]